MMRWFSALPPARRTNARMRIVAALLCLLALLSVASLASCSGAGRALLDGAADIARGGSGVGAPWSMFGKNQFRNRRYEHVGPATNQMKWRFVTGTKAHVRISPAIAADGTIYFATIDQGLGGQRLYAIKPDGREKWSYPMNGSMSSPAIGPDGTVYLGSSDPKVYAFNPNGTVKWVYNTTAATHMSSAAVSGTGVVYIGAVDGKIYSLLPNGTLNWVFATGAFVGSSPAIGSTGTIYVGSDDGNVYAINADGTEQWRYTTGGLVRSSAAIATDGTIYIGSNDAKLYALNPDGTVQWSFTTQAAFGISAPAIGQDGSIYIPGVYPDLNLYAIYPDGQLKWSRPTKSAGIAPAIDEAGIIFLPGSIIQDVGSMLAIDSADGSIVWSSELPGFSATFGSPAIGADGTVYQMGKGAGPSKKDLGPILYAFGPGQG